jgi:hypothetical protein
MTNCTVFATQEVKPLNWSVSSWFLRKLSNAVAIHRSFIFIIRKNPQHHVEFSHPGDSDYVDDLPECPYGITCYRKNKQHRLDFRHSTRPRKAKRPQNSKPYTSALHLLATDMMDFGHCLSFSAQAIGILITKCRRY